jgi:Bbp16-like protein
MANVFVPDLKNCASILQTLVPQTITTTTNGTGVDLQPTEGINNLVVEVGAVSGTTPSCVVTIQESADNSTWTNVTTNYNMAAITTGSQVLVVGFNSRLKRYLRAVFTITGTTPSFAISATFVSTLKFIGSSPLGNQL